MNTGKIAARYAKGLLKFSNEKGISSKLYSDSLVVINILKKSDSLSEFMRNPSLSDTMKLDFLKKSLFDSIHPEFFEFLRLIILKRRFEHLLNALLIYRDLYRSQNSILDVQIESATTLSEAELKGINTFINKQFNRTTELSVTHKPELIAGFILIVEGKILDYSVTGQLAEFKKSLGISFSN